MTKLSSWQEQLIQADQRKKVTKENLEKVIDINTGEVIQEKFYQEAWVGKEPNFVKIYIDNIVLLNNLPKGITNTVMELLKYMNYENMIVLNSYTKKEIAKNLGFKTVQSLNNSLNKLVKNEIFFRIGTGTYRANPFLFGKGDWNNIKQIRFDVFFGKDGIKQKAEFDYGDEIKSESEETD